MNGDRRDRTPAPTLNRLTSVNAALLGPQVSHLARGYWMCTPEIAREMTSRWISLVPSKIV